MKTRRWRLGAIGGLTVMLAAAVLPVAGSTPADAAGNDTISFGESGEKATFGANAIVAIDGTITFDNNCEKPGISDFVYPATDVYIMPTGAGIFGPLQDVGGGRPNTIVSGASMFIGEVIGVTAPAGQLDEGTYDVIYDTCQDGEFTPGKDTIFYGAITVELPEVLPLADGAITAMKDEARNEYYSWMATRFAMKGIFNLADRAIKVQCKAGNPIGCAMKQVKYFSGIKEKFLTLLLSQANHYLAIADDPPDPNFQTVTTLAPFALAGDHSDSAIANETADALMPITAEAALNEALLHAVERYQGAQVAGDAAWALVHAREARDLAAALAEIAPASSDALQGLRDAASTDAATLDQTLTESRAFVWRVWNTGFTPDERRELRNQGLGVADVAALENEIRSYTDQSQVTANALLGALDDSLADHSAMAAAAAESASKWDEIVAALEADAGIPDEGPAIDAGGPYAISEGASLTLAASASAALDSAGWDLDADGAFDDATGLTPSVSFATAGTYVIGLRATTNGHDAASYAVVHVAEANGAPVLSSPVPGAPSADVTVGDTVTFSVAATDPDGDPITYAWTVDGVDAAETGSSFTYEPAAGDVGEHAVDVIASDGSASGGATRRTWDVFVVAPDGDSDGWTQTTDCDDNDAGIHPTANELLGNDRDDDCDAATPDGPPGGLTGSMWGWGSNHNGTIGTGGYSPIIVDAPAPTPGYDNIVQAATGERTGYMVLDTGEVRSWGFGLAGNLGNGTLSGSATPVSPLAVGGGVGTTLSGVVQLSSRGDTVLARRTDGTAIAWGANTNGAIGNGSTVNYQTFPIEVLAGADGAPLTGVGEVEAGENESFALMQDGTVRAWGLVRCLGVNAQVEPYPVALPLVGGDIRQVSAAHAVQLFLKNDGTVLSCGSGRPYAGHEDLYSPLNVPHVVQGLGAGSGVIDISAGSEGAVVLKSDGTVWAWGHNANGSLSAAGVALNGVSATPVQVLLPAGPPVVDVDTHNACHTVALRADGSVLSWGCDFFGQGGDGPDDPTDPNAWIVVTPTLLGFGGAATIDIASSGWNGFVLTRPVDYTEWEPPATWVDASVADAAIVEGQGGGFAVTLSAALPYDVTVDWSVVTGTAGDDDLQVGGGTATVPAGSTTVQVPAPVVDDSLDEHDEVFTFMLTGASNGIQLARSHAAGTIEDDDAAPSISIQPATVTEGNTSLTDAAVTVQLSQPSGKEVAVDFATGDGEAISPADYQDASGRVVFAPGQQTAVVHVAVRGDSVVEAVESLAVSLTAPTNASLGGASATVTIVDDEPLALSVTSPTVTEGTGGTTPATFTVALSPAPAAGTSVSVDFEVVGLTADIPGDVGSAAGTLVFEPGEGTKLVTVDVVGDDATEPSEVFSLVLTNITATDGRLVLPGDRTVAVITDDDTAAPPTTEPPTTEPPTTEPPTTEPPVPGPAVSCAATPDVLWPPNHKLVPIAVTIDVADPSSFVLTSVTSNEPDDSPGNGDGATVGDIRGFDIGTNDLAGFLRAEREGAGTGRVYTLGYAGSDSTGNQITCEATVTVPHQM